jgi:GH15 family glucan-1,4-alpha-glucosidase
VRQERLMGARNGYLPIADYGVIGNLRTAALVGRDGSVDWCCLPRFDSPSLFAAILDRRRGGRFRVAPARDVPGEQRYLPLTNVLETAYLADGARLTVTDWMPLHGDLDGSRGSSGRPEIRRLVACEGGRCTVRIEWSPRFDYARAATSLERVSGGVLARGGTARAALVAPPERLELLQQDGGPVVRGELELEPGERVVLATCWDSIDTGLPISAASECLETTVAAWRRWVERGNAACDSGWAGEWRDLVVRSSLALKLLIHGDTGAIIAAPTTSLPEEIGGERNWDYRYCWIRDAAQTADALFAMGHRADARDYVSWAERVAGGAGEDRLRMRLMYDIDGATDLHETQLDHLEGYRCSRPVRIGNAAAEQQQLDIYGELLDAAREMVREAEPMKEGIPQFLASVADAACSRWHRPDHGIWETRLEKRHYVHSKVMVWVALARAVELATRGDIPGDAAAWLDTARRVKKAVLERGYDPELGSFVQSFGSDVLDASNLLIPIHGFLPAEDPRVQGTIDLILERLTVNNLVYRYRHDDGLKGGEGAFGLCTFWMVDALALSGRLDEACEIFETMAGKANHLGLFSEEVDPHSGELLGNFHQAFTHIGAINSSLYLAWAEGRELPVPSLSGTPERRAEADAAG